MGSGEKTTFKMFFPHDRYDSTGAFCFLPLGWKHRHGAKKPPEPQRSLYDFCTTIFFCKNFGFEVFRTSLKYYTFLKDDFAQLGAK